MGLKTWEEHKAAIDYMLANFCPYNNEYPFNLLHWNGYQKSADCWNWLKAQIWTDCEAAYDHETGDKHVFNGKYDLYDYTGAQILRWCYDQSEDMSNIQPGEFLYLVYNGGSHAGIYYGEVNGKRKVFEFSPIWAGGGQLTDIAEDGTRSSYGSVYAKWQVHGKLPWMIYPEAETVVVEPKEDITQIETDGDSDEHLTVWQHLWVEMIYAIAKAIRTVFPSK